MLELWIDRSKPGESTAVLADGDEIVASNRLASDLDERIPPYIWNLPGALHLLRQPDKDLSQFDEDFDRIGSWISNNILGEIAGELSQLAPATVIVKRVNLLDNFLLFPLGIASADGRSLLDHGITFVLATNDTSRITRERSQIHDRTLSILAIFTSPEQTAGLSARRERRNLEYLIDRLSNAGVKVSLTALQYGVTRKRIFDHLQSENVYDMLHVVAHGNPNGILLESETDELEFIRNADFLTLLEPLGQLGLAVFSTCQSVSSAIPLSAAEQDSVSNSVRLVTAQVQPNQKAVPEGIALSFAERHDSVVIGMRYNVDDTFAFNFSSSFYARLFRAGTSVDEAFRDATLFASSQDHTSNRLNRHAPVLIGSSLDEYTKIGCTGDLEPAGNASLYGGEYFVGRARLIAHAHTDLLNRRGPRLLALYGMPGIGKTSCAEELSDLGRKDFEKTVWWRPSGQSYGDPIQSLLTLLQRELMADLVLDRRESSADALDRVLGDLRNHFHNHPTLLVVDSAEALLNGEGKWIDVRWPKIWARLLDHHSKARVLLTTRTAIPSIPSVGVANVLVPTLDRDECALLIRQLPNLRSALLLQPKATVDWLYSSTQGHPQLLMLAEHDAKVTRSLLPVDNSVRSAGENGSQEESAAQMQAIGEQVTLWVQKTVSELSPALRLLLKTLCAAKPEDRESRIFRRAWKKACEELLFDASEEFDELLDGLYRVGLVKIDKPRLLASTAYFVPENNIRIHGMVTEAVLSITETDVQNAISFALAASWHEIYRWASNRRPSSDADRLKSGLHAVPYLLRLDFPARRRACAILDDLQDRYRRPDTVTQILSLVELAERVQSGSNFDFPLLVARARAVGYDDMRAAQAILMDGYRRALERNRLRAAVYIGLSLTDSLVQLGNPRLAKTWLDQVEQTHRAARESCQIDSGYAHGTLIGLAVNHVKVRFLRGEYWELTKLLERRLDIPAIQLRERDLASVTGEDILNYEILHRAYLCTEQWQAALDLSQWLQSIPSLSDDESLAISRVLDIEPLIRLGDIQTADTIIREFLDYFQLTNDLSGLTTVRLCQGLVAGLSREFELAIRFQRDALRYAYLNPAIPDLVGQHFVLAAHLAETADTLESVANLLAGRVLLKLSGCSINTDGIGPISNPEVHGNLARVSQTTSIGQIAAVLGSSIGPSFLDLVGYFEVDITTKAGDLLNRKGPDGGTEFPA